MSITPVQRAQLSASSTRLEDNLVTVAAASQIVVQRALEKTVSRFQKYQETAEANLVAIQEENALLRQRIASLEAEKKVQARCHGEEMKDLRSMVLGEVQGLSADLQRDIQEENDKIARRKAQRSTSHRFNLPREPSTFGLQHACDLQRRVSLIEQRIKEVS